MSSPRPSPARTAPPGSRKVASRIAGILPDRRAQGRAPLADDVPNMEPGATKGGRAPENAYRSFADATRSVLDLLAHQLPDVAVFLAHIDRGNDVHRIVDARNGGEFGLRSNLALPL